MTWELDPELLVLGHRYVAPREAEHPYDTKRRDDARIMREHEARCTVVGCCVAAEDGGVEQGAEARAMVLRRASGDT